MNKSGIIQAFNHEIAQQNQVKLRVGRVMLEFEFEDKEVYNGLEAKIPIPHLKLRQKQIDALLAHDITKPYCIAPNKEGVFCCLARIPILCLC
ncbi:hypothetical protein BTM354_14220 [Helicobacter pylori]